MITPKGINRKWLVPIFFAFFKIMSGFIRLSTEYMKELTKTKDKVIKTQKNITNFLHRARSFDFSN